MLCQRARGAIKTWERRSRLQATVPGASGENCTGVGQALRAFARRSAQEESNGEFDVGDNGMTMDRDERSALDALLGTIKYDKSKGRG